MPEKCLDHITIIALAVAAISGALGGCAVAGHHMLRGRRITAAYFFAYIIIGVVFGVLALIYGSVFGLSATSMEQLVGNSMIAGAAGTIALASTNLTARLILQRLGVEVQLTVKERSEK